jgi:hypothetical protein
LKKKIVILCILLAQEKVPHGAFVFLFQCTKKEVTVTSPALQNWFSTDARGK